MEESNRQKRQEPTMPSLFESYQKTKSFLIVAKMVASKPSAVQILKVINILVSSSENQRSKGLKIAENL